MTKSRLSTLLLTTVSCIVLFAGCKVDEFAFPAEFLQYPVNLSTETEPHGFLTWDWGITPDSAVWSGRMSSQSLALYREKYPLWVNKQKSGVEKFSLNLLPPKYSTAYGLTFNSVQLIFHPVRGLTGWDRIVYRRSSNSSETDSDSLYSTLIDSLAAQFGSPHLLASRVVDPSLKLSRVALWRSQTISVTLTQYNYINQQSKIYIQARVYQR